MVTQKENFKLSNTKHVFIIEIFGGMASIAFKVIERDIFYKTKDLIVKDDKQDALDFIYDLQKKNNIKKGTLYDFTESIKIDINKYKQILKLNLSKDNIYFCKSMIKTLERRLNNVSNL